MERAPAFGRPLSRALLLALGGAFVWCVFLLLNPAPASAETQDDTGGLRGAVSSVAETAGAAVAQVTDTVSGAVDAAHQIARPDTAQPAAPDLAQPAAPVDPRPAPAVGAVAAAAPATVATVPATLATAPATLATVPATVATMPATLATVPAALGSAVANVGDAANGIVAATTTTIDAATGSTSAVLGGTAVRVVHRVTGTADALWERLLGTVSTAPAILLRPPSATISPVDIAATPAPGASSGLAVPVAATARSADAGVAPVVRLAVGLGATAFAASSDAADLVARLDSSPGGAGSLGSAGTLTTGGAVVFAALAAFLMRRDRMPLSGRSRAAAPRDDALPGAPVFDTDASPD